MGPAAADNNPQLECWIDRGGTFTDCIVRDPATGELRVTKVRSSDEAVVSGIRQLLGLDVDAEVPACRIRLGTTLATNALLERKGAHTALITNRGFEDLPWIGDQTRPHLFAIDIEPPRPLPQEVIAIDARMDANGTVDAPLDTSRLLSELRAAKERGAESIAIVMTHAWCDGSLEDEIAEVARQAGFASLSISHRVANELGLLGRMDTATANAYLAPPLARYVEHLQRELPNASLQFMQSHGGLIGAGALLAKDVVLSGPAGGAVAAAAIAEQLGAKPVIGFDMGGTSTDVSRYDGEYLRRHENIVDGVRIRAPMIAIHTVAAGGGSICRVVGGRLTVGPDSAGATPGPLCYGDDAATEVTLTDCALVLGRFVADRFPFELDADRARRGLSQVVQDLAGTGAMLTLEQTAAGFVDIAVNNMASAIRRVTIAQGHDARGHTLVVFGGAAGQYACAVARQLGIERVIFHPYAGVLSAYGMGVARSSWRGERDAGTTNLDTVNTSSWSTIFEALEAEGRRALEPEREVSVTKSVALRYRATEEAIEVAVTAPADMRAAFERKHATQFGYTRPELDVEVVALRVSVQSNQPPPQLPRVASGDGLPTRRQTLWSSGTSVDAPVYMRENLAVDQPVDGPAVIVEDIGTIVVDTGFVAVLDASGHILVERTESSADAPNTKTSEAREPDPILLEVFRNRFAAIAEQMGAVLQRTAVSTNIRDRRDYSCAVFDAQGQLVANAPHIPVHLGAMSESVRALIVQHPAPSPGDVYATNDPADGGTHLPDITVVTPVFDDDGHLSFYVASRGHHADIGGVTPGSMPPFSTRLEEEGVVLRGIKLVDAGTLNEDALRQSLDDATYPARRPDDNVADLQAQIAANARGVALLGELSDEYGVEAVQRYMVHIQDHAAERAQAAIAKLPDGTYEFEDQLDDGAPVRVRIDVEGGTMTIDFTGSAKSQSSNLNAPRAVTMAAILYVVRLITNEEIPLNSGCLRPVRITIPRDSILDPAPSAAVAAGNVETSQRIVDVLLGALDLAAASQGTMNNLTFGSEELAYYETLGGGAGATARRDGRSGVHTHMTNSRCTDPEILEHRFPVRVRRFGLRAGSGGRGHHRGGDGLVREIEFLAPMTVSVISERRNCAPYGKHGGAPGKPGVNQVNGKAMGHRDVVEVAAGDVLRIETPGGGGWGRPT